MHLDIFPGLPVTFSLNDSTSDPIDGILLKGAGQARAFNILTCELDPYPLYKAWLSLSSLSRRSSLG